MDSVQNFELSGVVDNVLDEYLDFSSPSSIFGSSVKAKIKDGIASVAESRVKAIKDSIITELSSLCPTRRLRAIEINEDGSQRLLAGAHSFQDLEDKILSLEHVESAHAGYFAARDEVAVDVAIHVDKSFDGTNFQDALETVFKDLGPAQAIFNVGTGTIADIASLLAQAQVSVDFSFHLSFGFKVGSLVDFFDDTSSSVGGLFLRVNDLVVSAQASASGLFWTAFPSLFQPVSVVDGSFDLVVGLKLPRPFEISGTLASPLEYSRTITGGNDFVAYGHLSADLPLSIEIGGVQQDLEVLVTDGNLFDEEQPLVKVDFDACQVGGALQALLGKLGSFDISAENILGSVGLSGIDFFSNGTVASLDAMFPDVGQFVAGILNGT